MPKEPKLTARIRHRPTDGAHAMNLLTRKAAKSVFRPGQTRGNGAVFPATPRMQRSTVMVRYAENKLAGAWRAHGNYLAREHAQDAGRGFGFDGAREDIAIGDMLDEWQKAGDERLWKIIVSPEFGDRLNLREHIRELVKTMEQDLHTSLTWVAVDHYNTDNPHVHLLLRARGDKGGSLTLDKTYIREGIRLHSGAIATRQLGSRTEKYALLAREKQVESYRFTELDKQMLSKCQGNSYRMEKPAVCNSYTTTTRMQTIARMNKLVALGLAEYAGKLTWKIAPDLEKSLRTIGVISGQMKILERHRPMLTDKRQEMVRTELKEEGQRLTGIILGSGLDPETDKPYLLLEATDGRAHFILQSKKLEEMRISDTIKDGSVIALEVKRFVNAQGKEVHYQHIENFGSKKEALLNPELLDKEILATLPSGKLPALSIQNNGFASSFHEAIAKRAELLESRGLINRFGNGAFMTANWKDGYRALLKEEGRLKSHGKEVNTPNR